MKVKVTSGDGGGSGSCTGYVSEQAVIPAGTSLETLATYNNYATGVGGWPVAAGTQSRAYQITWTFDTTGLAQAQVDQMQGGSHRHRPPVGVAKQLTKQSLAWDQQRSMAAFCHR